MSKIIYSKFSNERAPQFQIRTDIGKDDSGAFFVRKVAVDDKALDHIRNVAKWYDKLLPIYAKAGMKPNKATLSSDAAHCVDLEYLTGYTLQDKIDELYSTGDYSAVCDVIIDYAAKVRSIYENTDFAITDRFVEVFGKVEFAEAKAAAAICNIDLIFPNIIIKDGIWHVIDYEWTFDFAVPVDFVIYRAVNTYLKYSNASHIPAAQLYTALGITPDERDIYARMEVSFQQYVMQGTLGARQLRAGILPAVCKDGNQIGVLNIEDAISSVNHISGKKEDRLPIQVFMDKGNGFIEADSLWINPSESDDELYVIDVPEGITCVRIDPREFNGLMHLRMIALDNQMDWIPDIEMNSNLYTDRHYMFDSSDPNLVIKNVPNDKCRIKLRFTYTHVDDEMHKVTWELVELRKQKAINDDLKAKLRQLQRAAEADIKVNPIKRFFNHHYGLKMVLKNTKRILTKGGVKGMREFNDREWELRKYMHVIHEFSLIYNLEDYKKECALIATDAVDKDITFSIIVPLYNTNSLYLRKMIESVIMQTYPNWELCLADGSDKAHRYVLDICHEYAYHDKRIKYHKLKSNEGIVGNTNACLELATGNYFALLDHDDCLHPTALYDNYKAIKDSNADFIYSDEALFNETVDDAYKCHYKPDFSPDYLRSLNYICHLSVFSKALYDEVGGFLSEYEGSQDYDLILRMTEKAKCVAHIPKLLYYWRAHEDSTAMDISAKTYCVDAGKKALGAHLDRVGLKGEVLDAKRASWYRVKYDIKGEPLVSIIIPNMDHIDILKQCVESIISKTTHRNYEIIIVENNSRFRFTEDYYASLCNMDNRIRLVKWDDKFNYSAINNFGITHAKGDYVLLLNNDIEVINPEWLTEMLMYAQREDVGAVGAKLYYPDNSVQHAGVILGIGGVAGHSHKYFDCRDDGYMGRLILAQDLSAVTAACMLIPRKVYDEVGGLDEGYEVAFNDVDLCMKIREAGYLIVYTPYAELYHHESISRGYEDNPEKVKRFNSEIDRFHDKWGDKLKARDPYYNPNLTLVYEDFSEKR